MRHLEDYNDDIGEVDATDQITFRRDYDLRDDSMIEEDENDEY